MLTIKQPRHFLSPAVPLIGAVPHALGRVAPEYENEIAALLDDLTIEVIDDPGFICRASSEGRWIRVSAGVLEVLWCQAYGAYVFYQRELAGTQPAGDVTAIRDSQALRALELYRWALRRMLGKRVEQWPAELPRPTIHADDDAAERVAEEIALVGLGHLMLHELAHVVLGHLPGGDSIAMEQDADNWAADRVLGSAEMDEMMMAKRSLGVALALLLNVALSIHRGSFGGRTHPRSFDRLFNTLAHRVPPDCEIAWAMVVALLGLHMTAKQIPVPKGPFDTFAEAADSMISTLAVVAEGMG
jgi:hypothetical protein